MGTNAIIVTTGGSKDPFMDPISILSKRLDGYWDGVVPAIPGIIEKCEKKTEEDLFNAVSNAIEKEFKKEKTNENIKLQPTRDKLVGIHTSE